MSIYQLSQTIAIWVKLVLDGSKSRPFLAIDTHCFADLLMVFADNEQVTK